jgi:glutamate dehydrogenase
VAIDAANQERTAPSTDTNVGGNAAKTDEAIIAAFVDRYYADIADGDLIDRSPGERRAAALAHLEIGRQRPTGTAIVRVYQPDLARDGWESHDLVVDVVTDDMPFVVESVAMELNRHGFRVHDIIHPVMRVRRDEHGRSVAMERWTRTNGEPPTGSRLASTHTTTESFVHVQFQRHPSSTDHGGGPPPPVSLDALRDDILRVLDDVRDAVEDWPAMRDRALSLADSLGDGLPGISAEDTAEAAELLRWMADDRFTFLGAREYDLITTEVASGSGTEERDALRVVPGTGLGILRDDTSTEPDLTVLAPVIGRRAREVTLLNLTKANARSTVHRPTPLDYIGIKRFGPDGEVTGERRFLGLFTSAAYNASAFDVPVLRRKATEVVERTGFPAGGHSVRQLIDIIETYPRDELFQIGVDELYANALGILRLHDRQHVRLFRRVDPFERFVSCLVFVPRDRYTTPVRERMRDILLAAHAGTAIDYTARVTESALARLHFVVTTEPGHIPPVDVSALEAELVAASRSWVDDLNDELETTDLVASGDADLDRAELFERFGHAFPAAYREDYRASTGVRDLLTIARLRDDGDLSMSLYRPDDAPANQLRLKMFRTGERISLSDILPVLEHLGMTVVDERPYRIRAADGIDRWVYDFGLQVSDNAASTIDRYQGEVLDALAATWRGDAESDGFNRLVVEAGLTWRQVVVLRAYRKYLRQTGSTFSQTYIERTLAARPEPVRLLMALFDARFNPDRPLEDDETRAKDIEALALQYEVTLELIESLDEDRIFRSFFHLVQATTRTNFYQVDDAGHPKPYLSLKLDPQALPDLPEPRPVHEIWVHSPRLEGVHLRGGDVARGGLRWSDRPEDFRTEILGLMKAQLVKNSVIVPTGAKGGFVVKHPPPGGDRDALQAEAIACYRAFISALLDVTDNLVGGAVVPPERVIRHDGDDTYLVVAADKGTATFSDIANELSISRGFWLGDAFASGGSSGYDHKKMGITARGAWESVKRHFRELEVDVQTTDFTAVGIGDMSGDVFGNAMLRSPHTRLVAAFDHRHIFLDPDPDPSAGFEERARLFALPRSSWDDYDRSLLSEGGGIFPRTAKSIPISPQVRTALGIDAERLAPPDLIRAVLQAPVDLLFNGGVGTYVKARSENNAEVGDKANDAVRVNGSDLRCRVVGEGGNLGFTQRGRVEAALGGCLLFTDAIDNSAGVDCSDHEVNIKVLLDSVVHAGRLTTPERDRLLVEMTDDVAAKVLHHNYEQTLALSVARSQAPSLVDVHARYIDALSRAGELNRDLEFLPDSEELAGRRAHHKGLTTPELAVLLAYAKVTLDHELLQSELPEDPYFAATIETYFPDRLRETYATEIQSHPLRREIITTTVSNEVIDRGGTSFLYRLTDETQASLPEIARCHLIASNVFGMSDLWQRVEALDEAVSVHTQIEMLLASRTLVERTTRWLLQNQRTTRWLLQARHEPATINATVALFSDGVAELTEHLPKLLVGGDLERFHERRAELVERGVPEPLAEEVAGLDMMTPALDLIEITAGTDRDVNGVAAVYFTLGDELRFDWLREHIVALPRDDRWNTLARASLRADLAAKQRSITAEILAAGSPPGDVESGFAVGPLIDAWIDAHRVVVEHYRQIITDMKGKEPDIAVLSVALRVAGDLIDW